MRRRSLNLSLACSALAAALAPVHAWSQAAPAKYPAKPVTIIVPFTAGQSGDVLARVLGEP
ncbi:MAG: ABC transporter substrate-binding protein, partial [Comamonas sp.]